jgi:hypothetical protein
MSLRPPGLGRVTPETALDLLEHEVAGEMASSLGRAGRRVEETLARLAAAEAGDPMRPDLLADAADAVYWYFIQRELCGLRRHADVIREYAIPKAVLARLGAR